MEQINLYNIKKKELLQGIQQATAIMERLNMSKEGGMCNSLYKRLRDDTFKVVIMGEFKVGKSTFINAMLGSGDILPAKATPCTAVINEVKYSKEHYAIIYFKHPIPSPLPKLAPNIKKYIESFQGKRVAPIKIDALYLNQFVVIDDEVENPDEAGKDGIAQTPFARAEIFWDLPICEQGVEFIDTPGLNENETRTNVTLNYLTQADAIIFVLDCTRALSKTERQSIENDVVGKGHQYVLYVCNKINLVKEKERHEVEERMIKGLSSKTKLGEKGIFCINAEDAKDGRAENDPEKFARSGMAEFEAQLDNVLANKRGSIKLLQPARQLESLIEYALATAIPNERKMLELSTQELDQRLQKEIPNLQRLKHEKELLTEQIDNEVKKICRDTELLLKNRYNEIISLLPEWIDNIRCDSAISLNPLKLKQSIRPFSEELIEKLQNKLTDEQTDWQNRQLQPFVVSHLQEMAKKFESNVTRIFVDIENIKLRITGVEDVETPNNLERIGAIVAGLFGGGVSGAIVGGSLGFSKEFAATIAAHIAIYLVLGGLLGATNPITLIALVATTLVGLVSGAVKVEDKIRKKVAEQVIAQIRKDSVERISEGIKVLMSKLNQGAANFSTAIDKEIYSVEQLVEKIKRDKQAGEQKVKKSIAKLEQDKAALQGLLTNIQALIKSMEENDIPFEPLDEGPVPQICFCTRCRKELNTSIKFCTGCGKLNRLYAG